MRGSHDFHQQRVIIRCDHRAGVTHASIQPNAEAAGRAIGEDPSVVGHELVFRVLGRQAALDRVAIACYLVLERHAHLRAVQLVALGNEDLRSHQVEPGDDLRDGVLHLDARVHFDEEPFVGVEVEEEFDRAGVVVFDFVAQPHGGRAQFIADALLEVHAGRNFDHLLMPALHGAIPLVQVNHVPVLVPQDLHFDVFRARDVFLQKHRRVAKRTAGLGLRLVQQPRQVGRLVDHPHAAAAPAKRGLDDERKADAPRDLQGFLPPGDRLLRPVERRHPQALGQGPRGGFVPHHVQQLGPGAHKGYPRPRACPGKLRILAQKAIAGMNGLDPGRFRQGNDAVYIQVGRHGPLAVPDLVRLIGFKAVDAEAILRGVNGHGAQPEVSGRTEDADGDLGAIGRQKLGEPSRGRWRR